MFILLGMNEQERTSYSGIRLVAGPPEVMRWQLILEKKKRVCELKNKKIKFYE